MNTLRTIAEGLRQGRKGMSDVELARKTGLTRQSVSRALSGEHNYNVNSLLAIAEANEQVVMLIPRDAARALMGINEPEIPPIATMTSGLLSL